MDIETVMSMLKSINAGTRLQACKELFELNQSTPEIISALEKATHDRDSDVAAAAQKVLDKFRGVISEEEKILLTTTHQLEGYFIERYLGIVSSEVVLGTGLLSEFGASLADLLGERAGKFQNKLREAKEWNLAELRHKAVELQANAVVGLAFDYSVLSNNMLMVVTNGTAVQIVPTGNAQNPDVLQPPS